MREELLINTRLTRRMFHKVVSRLERDREHTIEDVERLKGTDDPTLKKAYNEAIADVRDLDLMIEALYEED